METQSVWRRGHFLFDVHHGHMSLQKGSVTSNVHDLLVCPAKQQAIDPLSYDHGLIYHNPLPFNSLNVLNPSRSTSWLPSIRFPPFRSHYDSGSLMYQGDEFDAIGDKEAALGHVFGGELNECFRVPLSTVISPLIRPQPLSPHREKRGDPLEHSANLKAREKRKSSSDLSGDSYNHKRTRS